MDIRVIIVSTESGEQEEVTFTEDFDAPAEDFCNPEQTVDTDEVCDLELPGSFPMETTLRNI